MDALSLDQLRVFVTTVDEGSFSGASRALNRAQSAITYVMQKLEDQIGAALFDRSTYRPTLTRAGRALLPRARRILIEVDHFRSQAKGMVHGLEAEVRFGLSEMLPVASLTRTFAAFHRAFPTVLLRIVRKDFGLGEALAQGEVDLALLPDLSLPPGIDRNQLAPIALVAVAAPGHPLSASRTPVPTDMLREHLQIVLTDPRADALERDMGVAALDSWRVTDLATKHALLLDGVGWGSMPSPLVGADIAAGRLRVLTVERWDGSDRLPRFPVVIAHAATRMPGPAGTALLESILRDRAGLTWEEAGPSPDAEGLAG